MIWRQALEHRFAGMRINEVQQDLDHAVLDIDRSEVGVGRAAPVTLDDGKRYYVSHGYYVPYYDSGKGRDAYTERNSIISEFSNRMDSCAYTDRDPPRTFEQIKELEAKYDEAVAASRENKNAPNSDIRFYGAKLVLAMIDLIGRIEGSLIDHHDLKNQGRPSFMFKTAGFGQVVEGYADKTPDEQKAVRTALRAQNKYMFERLVTDMELVSQLRRQTPIRHRAEAMAAYASKLYTKPKSTRPLSDSFDTTGIFSEMIREVGKATLLPRDSGDEQKDESKIEQGTLLVEQSKTDKIGRALHCVDAIGARLAQACDMHPALDEVNVRALLENLSDTARGTISTRSYHTGGSDTIEARFFAINNELKDCNHRLREAAQNLMEAGSNRTMRSRNKRSAAALNRLVDTLEFGCDLIDDMAHTQFSCAEILWPDNTPMKVPKPEDVKMPAHRQHLTFESDLDRVDARSDMALFEQYSDETFQQLGHNAPQRVRWQTRVKGTNERDTAAAR